MTRRMSVGLLAAAMATGAAGVVPVAAIESWVNVTGDLAYKQSECGNLTLLSPVPDSVNIIAGIAARGLWVNTTGTTWSRLSDIGASDTITNRPQWIVYDPANPAVFWESGIYNDGGVYKTTDGGKTFRRLGNVTHNDFVSVDFADPDRRTLLAGGHEQEQTVYLSTDSGKTWRNVGTNVPSGIGATTHPLLIDASTFLVNAVSRSGPGGIYRSRDGGLSWQRVSAQGPPGPPLRASNGIIYWAANGGLLRSTNLGSTWIAVGNGLRPIRPVELPDGRLVAVGKTTLVVSADGGTTWSQFGAPLPYEPDGLIYSPQRKAFFIWHADCGQRVLPNAVMKLDFDVSSDTASR